MPLGQYWRYISKVHGLRRMRCYRSVGCRSVFVGNPETDHYHEVWRHGLTGPAVGGGMDVLESSLARLDAMKGRPAAAQQAAEKSVRTWGVPPGLESFLPPFPALKQLG